MRAISPSKNCIFIPKMFGNPDRKIGEPAKHISIAGNQSALSIGNSSQCSEAVDLQFK
jgi:hypothetical protein